MKELGARNGLTETMLTKDNSECGRWFHMLEARSREPSLGSILTSGNKR
jgi:hypothetical protein